MSPDRLIPPAEPALLESAKWRGDVALGKAVDGNRAGANGAGGAMSQIHIARIQRCRQAVICLIGEIDSLFLARKSNDAEHRAKDFLAGDLHVVGDSIKDG